MARGLTQGWVEQGGNTVTTDGRVSTTLVQRSYPEATVTVFNAGTVVLATIFSDEGGTPLANPFVADGNGKWEFWADQGRYDIQFSGAGITSPYTYADVDVVPSAATLPDPGGNGFVVRTALGVTVARSLTQPAAGITITNPAGLAGNATFALANDLAALEGLGGTGYAVRTAADTWAQRTITGTANNILITDGNGVAGNTVINIGANVVTNTGGVVTDNQLVRMDGTSGRLIQGSAVVVADTSGSFTVPNNWQVANAAGNTLLLANPLFSVSTPTTATTGFSSIQLISGSQTQTSGVASVVGMSQTFNQGGTAGSDSLFISRVETAQGSGQHNFIRCLGGVAGTTVQFRVDRLGNIYQTANPAIIGDVNGNEQLRFVPTAAAVNEWTFTNAATGGTPSLAVTGGDANPNGRISAKGTGRLILPGYPFTIEINTNIVAASGGGLVNLHSYTVPANTLVTNGDYIEVWHSGTFAADADAKGLSMNIAGTNTINSGPIDIGNNAGWSMHTRIIRLTATSIRTLTTITAGLTIVTEANTANGGTVGGIMYSESDDIVVANLASNTFQIIAQSNSTNAGDVSQNLSIIQVVQRA